MASGTTTNELSFAVLTPPGRAAIATVAVFGAGAWMTVRELFRRVSGSLPESPDAGQSWFGKIGDSALGFDEVVLAVKQVGPITCVEIHCHGGSQVIELLRNLFGQRGCRECSWQEFLRLTMADRLRAAAAVALAEAATLRTAAILLDQYHGAFARAVGEVVMRLRNDAELPLTPDPSPRSTGERGDLLAALVRWCGLGRHLTSPWRVVIAGAPNAGKSRLVNALAGFERSIVSPLSGTTRDLVTTAIAIDGWPVELIDTAGVRNDAEPLEREGILRAQLAAAQADLCLWLVDSSSPPLLAAPRANLQMVISKIDLPVAWDVGAIAAPRISAETGEGVEELIRLIGARLVPAAPWAGAAVPFSGEICDAIERAHAHCLAGRLMDALAELESLFAL